MRVGPKHLLIRWWRVRAPELHASPRVTSGMSRQLHIIQRAAQSAAFRTGGRERAQCKRGGGWRRAGACPRCPGQRTGLK